jgi:muconate cycloisomerase
MKIKDLSLDHVAVHRQYRTVVAEPGQEIVRAGAEPTLSHFYILRVQTDEGITGLGEVSDIDERIPSRAELERQLKAALVGVDPFRLEALMTGKVRFDSPLVDCAVDSALYDIQGKKLGVSVSDLVGGRVRDAVLTSWVVYIRTPDLVGDEMAEMIARHGFTAFKLKVGIDFDHDDECVRIMREVAGPAAQIKLDASGAWTKDEAIRNIRRMERHGLQGVETPVGGRDPRDLAAVRQAVETPIIEHVGRDLGAAAAMARHASVDIFNVATVSAGGIYRAKKLLGLAEAAGIDCLLGSTVELGIGTAGQLHLAGTSAIVTYPSDLIGPALYIDDVLAEPFRYDGGTLPVPTGPGLGVELDVQKLARQQQSEA